MSDPFEPLKSLPWDVIKGDPIVKDPSFVQEEWQKDHYVYAGVCEPCEWSSAQYSSEPLAAGLLRRHRTKREHRTAIIRPYGFRGV